MEALEEEQEGEERNEAWGEVVPEHGERQARLGHRVPGALDQMLTAETRAAAQMRCCTLQLRQCFTCMTQPLKGSNEEKKTDVYLHFCSSELSKKDLPHELSQQKHQHERLNVQHLMPETKQ